MKRLCSLLLAVVGAGFVAAGCAVTSGSARQETAVTPLKGHRVLIMDPDVVLYVLTAGGLLEPNAEWTEAARGYVESALRDELRAKGVEPLRYGPPQDPAKKHALEQLLKLHDVVAGVVAGGGLSLPTKKGRLDWSLGDAARTLRDAREADYALFVLLRDSYASAGRHSAAVAVAILSLGTASLPLGQQRGAASLVDLRTGEVVWVNQFSSPAGDLRTPGSARKAAAVLLGNLPK